MNPLFCLDCVVSVKEQCVRGVLVGTVLSSPLGIVLVLFH
jgi:hypothetical protein